jgi:hypothetical protein
MFVDFRHGGILQQKVLHLVLEKAMLITRGRPDPPAFVHLPGLTPACEARRWDAARTAAAEAKPPAAKRQTRGGDR